MFKAQVKHTLTGEIWEEGPFKTQEQDHSEGQNLYKKLHTRYSKKGALASFSVNVVRIEEGQNKGSN